jgi:hypothetical protein
MAPTMAMAIPMPNPMAVPLSSARRTWPSAVLPKNASSSRSSGRVEQSSLLRRIAVMNYVHPRNGLATFDQFDHYILTFEDSTFESVAKSYGKSIDRAASDDERWLQ